LILIISHPGDEHATAVQAELTERRVDSFLLDTSRFPSRSAVSMLYQAEGAPEYLYRDAVEGSNGHTDTPVPLHECEVAWWRRPMPFTLHGEIASHPTNRQFAVNEIHEAIAGLWPCLEARWINPVDRDELACHKVFQLKMAQRAGLVIPETLITNDPGQARAFAGRHGCENTIYKAFLASEGAWRETRLLRPEELALLDSVRFAPVIFQEYVPADIDLRVTVIGDRIFPAAIHSQKTQYRVDYRMEMGKTEIEPHQLPDEVEEKLRAFMRTMGLVYGAIDLRRRPSGEYVFLEVNPSGQWLFIEERTGLPLTRAFTETLLAMREAPVPV
jgi:hypothetical protein